MRNYPFSPTNRYFRCADLLDRAREEGAKPERIERLKAWEAHLAAEARQAMRTPFTIADLFAGINASMS